MEAQTLNKDVIYVYSEPVFSKENEKNSNLYKLLLVYLKSLSDDRQRLQRVNENRKRDLEVQNFDSVGSKFLKKLSSSLNIRNADQIEAQKWLDKSIENVNNTFRRIEEPIVELFPIKYKNNFFSKINHSIETEDDMEKYIKNLPEIFHNFIKDLKNEISNVDFYTIEELNSLANENKIQIVNSRRFSAGQVFIKHPFVPNTYMDVEESENTLFHIKMQCLSRIMQCLGASHISGHAYVSETKKREIDVNGKISYKVVDIEGTVNKTKDEKYESDYSLEDTFAGEFSKESYEEALSEAKRVGLYDDFDVKNLLEQRNPEKQNKMLGRKVKIELNRELNENLDSAFELQAAGFTMNGTYNDILETERKVMFELQIEF